MKLHLPKMLFTAVVAAACCVQQAKAVDYSVYKNNTITINQWTGTTAKTSICYGLWYSASYDETTNTLIKSETATGTSGSSDGYKNIVNDEKYIMFDAASTSNNSGRAQYDASPISFAGIIVMENAAVSTLAGTLTGTTDSNRIVTIGTANSTEEAPTYTVIASNFTLSNAETTATATFTLQGYQKWEIADNKTFTLKTKAGESISQTGNLTISGGGTVEFASVINNSGTLTVEKGAVTIHNTIINNGSFNMGSEADIIIGTLSGLQYDLSDLSSLNYDTSGIQNFDTKYFLYKGNAITGVSSVTYGSETIELDAQGSFSISTEAFVVANNDSVTVGGSTPTEGAGTATLFALADTGTLVFADIQSSTLVKEVIGTGRVEVTLGTDTNHDRGVQLGDNFHGTLAVFNGKMNLTTFTTADDATLELHNGEHWSNGTKTLAQNINLKATEANGYVFRNGDTLTLAGTVTGKYLDLGTTNTNNGTLVLSGENNAIEYVNIGTTANKMSLTVAADMAFTRVSAPKADSAVTIEPGKTMTLNGGTAEGDKTSTIGTLSAGSATVVLGEGVQLTLGTADTASTSSIDTVQTASGGNTIYLNAAATLNKINTVSGSATLDGSGTYNLGASKALTNSVSFAETWTGSVKVTGTVSGQGDSATLTRYDIDDLEDLEVFDTTAEGKIVLSGVKGYFTANEPAGENNTFSADIVLENYELNGTSHAALVIDDGYGLNDTQAGKTDRHTIINGSISGSGDLEFAKASNDAKYLVQGDVSYWTGSLKATKNTLYLVTGGEATTWHTSIIKGQRENNAGVIHLSVDNTGKTTTFNKEVSVNSLTVTDGSTAKFTAKDEESGNSKLNIDGNITLGKGAVLDVTGSITLNAANINLANGITFDSADAVTLVRVTDGTLSVNNVSTWTGGTYTIDGKEYTTSLNASDNLLQLIFNSQEPTSLLVDSAVLVEKTLTLNVDADLTGINYVNLTLSDTVLETIDGKYGEVGITLAGLNGSEIIGNGVDNIMFYGKYVGEGNGMYRIEYIPEPTTATLGLLALAGLAARRRRR